MFEKATRLEDPKNRITPPGSPIFSTLRILQLRLQNPKDPKIRFTKLGWFRVRCLDDIPFLLGN